MAEDVRSYLQPSYWDERFSKESHYEWFKDYTQFRHLIQEHCTDKNAKILELGCGNSRMSEDMYEDGFVNITATDLSAVAVESKRQRCSSLNQSIKVLVARVETMLKETHRVLAPNGVFISIAFGQPHFRRPFFEASGLDWSMEYFTFGDTFHYYFYVLRKGTRKFLTEDLVEKPSIDMVQEQMDEADYLENND